ncbi:MAG: bifunctional phosphoribosylaminoimidazolecarboxamide formyltransferase/IMP cyclohydrolase [Thaumarchaeota archaeon]|nr:bifunctional phosphoribosylaminoimidazolecarboxamide formyltransferase/IMP cyclohydrolase [Nitrososphaerota archaeon]
MPEEFRKVSTALISVYRKQGLAEFASSLNRLGIKIISTGGTRATIEGAGIPVKRLEEVARFPEMLDGRVKTLQPEILAAILARRIPDHLKQLENFKIEPIDMVVCNFYPFEDTIAKPNVTYEDAIENIDIGGPSMVRAAAKNHESVAVVTSPKLYEPIVEELNRNRGALSGETKRRLAEEAFGLVAAYDIAIYNGLNKFKGGQGFPDKFYVSATKFQDAKYGENPSQKAAVYKLNGYTSMLDWRQLFGDSRSFNNHLDIGHAYEILEGFDNVAAAATVKHGNISGFAFAPTAAEAYQLAHECDPQADYGGAAVLNRKVDAETAKLIGKNTGVEDKSVYTEIVIAPEYDEEALKILEAKQTKKMRIIEATQSSNYPFDLRFIQGALLVQTPMDYHKKINAQSLEHPTKLRPSEADTAKLLAAWEVVRKVESNGIVIGNGRYENGQLTHFWTLGVGSFRKRNGATKIALDNAGNRAKGAIAASDGFFPFPDSVELLGQAGIKSVIQPGGSIRDEAVIETANRLGIAIAITHERAFKH